MPHLLPDPPESFATADALAALSLALDLTEGQPLGHSVRACGIAMEISWRAGFAERDRRTLFHAALLKDAGCSSNSAEVFRLFGGSDHAAKRDLKRVDWSRYFEAARYAVVHAAPGASWAERARRIAALAAAGPAAANRLVDVRCRRGAAIASQLGFGDEVSDAVAGLDEHWDGHGRPAGRCGTEVPLASRVMLLAQTLDVFLTSDGPAAAFAMARERAGTWFDPELVRAALDLEDELDAWRTGDLGALRRTLRLIDPAPELRLSGGSGLARVAESFAAIVDAKSPFTERHSRRVADVAEAIADELGCASPMLRIAALLHDLGKLGVPNEILDKPGRLSASEWEVVRRHPADSLRVLEQLDGLGDWASVAAAHHERMDGRGYHLGLGSAELPREARLLAVADVWESLTADRPYRAPMPREEALAILAEGRGSAFDGNAVDALVRALDRGAIDHDAALPSRAA